MAELENMRTEVENNQVTDTSIDYISAINEMKQNSVDRAAYDKLRAENKQLLNTLVNGQKLDEPVIKEEPVDIDGLRSKLFNTKHKDMNNLEFVENALKLREALINNGEMDPFVPVGNKITPTDEDFQKAEKVAKVLQECVDYADGNPAVFVDELKRNIN